MKVGLLVSRALQKKYATGRPDQKDLNENLAATQGLAHMITECNRLFEVPPHLLFMLSIFIKTGLTEISEIGR